MHSDVFRNETTKNFFRLDNSRGSVDPHATWLPGRTYPHASTLRATRDCATSAMFLWTKNINKLFIS